MDEYSKIHGHSPAIITGKPVELGGSPMRVLATGFGVAHIAQLLMRERGIDIKNATIALQGFGNLGMYAARFLSDAGAKIIAISTHEKAIYDPQGLPINELAHEIEHAGTIDAYKQFKTISQRELLTLPCDILIPAAIEGVITADLVPLLKCSFILEGANDACTQEADELLTRTSIDVVPDILANAGGVIASYGEWAQNSTSMRWTPKEEEQLIINHMTQAYDAVAQLASSKKVSRRIAALMIALDRVARAHVERTH